jgi:hypothetical protein
MKVKDQSVKLKAEDVPHFRAIKREMPNLSTARLIGATVRGWRYLTPEQKLSAINGQPASTSAA